ncbi:MAG TPA: F0F1 ATP synthase subunit B [Acidimicrobiia bacterium]|nr:F0F1 ATP synthase subunit B [Acidimicrobiia bacterium]
MHPSTFILATTEGGESSGVELLLPAWPELIAGIIAFSLVFFFVWRWVWPSLSKTIETRQGAIAGELTAAEKAKAEAESLRADYQAQLANARAEASRIVEEARKSAEQIRADIIAKAEVEAEQIRARAREEAAGEKARALAEAKSQVGDIAIELASKIVGEALDEEKHKALIDRYLADLEKI